MTEYSDYRLIDSVEELLKKAQLLCQRVLKYTRELTELLEQLEQDCQLNFPPNCIHINDIIDAQNYLSELESLHSTILSSLDKLFWCMYEADFLVQIKQIKANFPHAISETTTEKGHIKVRFHNGALYIKAPPVFTNFNHTLRVNGHLIQKEYGGFYSYELAEIMQEYYDPCSRFGPRNINILAVYEKQSRHIPDTINLDFKTMIDAITNVMIGGDQWDYCSFSMSSIVSGVLEKGTYFTVTNGFAATPGFKENLENLISLFAAEGE